MEPREGHGEDLRQRARGVRGTCRHPEAPAAGYHNIMTSSGRSLSSTAGYLPAEEVKVLRMYCLVSAMKRDRRLEKQKAYYKVLSQRSPEMTRNFHVNALVSYSVLISA
jgi:hypothetical protein